MRRPDILIFNPDQWRGDVLGHMGNPAAVTPCLDAACDPAKGGGFVSFRNAFCQNPVCTPSRCSFMTGWYPHVRGHRTMHHMLHPERGEPVLLKQLKDAGYFVWWGGKNDLVSGADAIRACCDIRHEPEEGALPMFGPNRSWRGAPEGDLFYSFLAGRVDKGSADHYHDSDWSHVFAARDLILSHRGDQPLCIYLPLSYPHPPYGVEEPWFSLTNRERLPLRIPAPADWKSTGKPCLLEGISERQGLRSWDEQRWNELRATYYGMCARVDHQFGILLQALKDAGRYDQSAVFFLSDHGDFTGDYGLVEKTQNTFEDCLTRVPLLIKPPGGVKCQPGIRDSLVELVDFTATVYDFSGVTPDYDHFGRTLRGLMENDEVELRGAVFCEGGRLPGETQAMELASPSATDPASLYWPRVGLQARDDRPWHGKAVMCRTASFKYVQRRDEADEFYDLSDDPGETVNRIADPACKHAIAAMKERILQWWIETCDVVPRTIDSRK